MTGHAEVVMVEYDADVISYEDLLKVFWSHHDPTTPNRQGPDVGTQYRSIILYHSDAQRKAALKSYHELVARRVWRYPIVTQLVPLTRFYRAEDYHQDYYGGKPRTSTRRRKTTAVKSRSAIEAGKFFFRGRQARRAAGRKAPRGLIGKLDLTRPESGKLRLARLLTGSRSRWLQGGDDLGVFQQPSPLHVHVQVAYVIRPEHHEGDFGIEPPQPGPDFVLARSGAGLRRSRRSIDGDNVHGRFQLRPFPRLLEYALCRGCVAVRE